MPEDAYGSIRGNIDMIGAIQGISRVNAAFSNPVPRVLGLLMLWHRRASTRRTLGELPPERLRDVGLTEMDAAFEAARPFWQGRL
ncbi:DUF1127 domain-containing protein [Roseomonas populi]|uniref:DUF1127 domain-containing protein n=1 Tax=Roseomonas populi TaxID=3121582 RepID=A0ABT1X3V7_9PROT|nr:DUF1127 domain-containing protein [Roseomonas pecuniae]MCR0982785.1 DUF1127 domain-containing protein [Roseomonas pecuniae]